MLNWKKLYRIYREERLMVRKRGGRKRALGTRAPMAIPQGANQRWSLDFVSDALACGRKFRILTVVDDFSRECLALVVDNSLSGIRVPRELDRADPGPRQTLHSDNGTQLTSRAMLAWQQDHRSVQQPARGGRIIEAWKIDYNTSRPHSSLGGLTPMEFARPDRGHNQNRLSSINEGISGSTSGGASLRGDADDACNLRAHARRGESTATKRVELRRTLVRNHEEGIIVPEACGEASSPSAYCLRDTCCHVAASQIAAELVGFWRCDRRNPDWSLFAQIWRLSHASQF